MREAIARAPVRSGHDYLVIATPEVIRVPFVDLVSWVSRAVEE